MLFCQDLIDAINAEFTETVESDTAYYIQGADVDVSHLPDPDAMDTYSSQRLWHDAAYRAHWEKKLNIQFE